MSPSDRVPRRARRIAGRGLAAAVVALALAASVGCAAPPAPRAVFAGESPTRAEWIAARAQLDALRASAPSRPYVAEISVSMREPRTGKVFDARGAIAVSPRRALRMILVGPGGATTLDAWVSPERYRLAVPPIAVVRRGAFPVDPRDATLPVGFLRWWFLRPLEGRVLAARGAGGRLSFLLEGDGAVVSLHDARTSGRGLLAERAAGGIAERIEHRGGSLSPTPGERSVYVHEGSGLRVEVEVLRLGDEAPDEEAFVEPKEGAP